MKAAESPTLSTVAAGPSCFAPTYLLAIVVGALSVIVLFGVSLVSLDIVGNLPPPQIANNLCVDEKLRFLRNSSTFDAPDFAPDVLAVGSSVTWRTFDGEAVEGGGSTRARFFNGGFCGLKVNETAFAARYFLKRYPSVREVVTILAPQDMTQCGATVSRFFDTADVDRYVYGEALVFPLYLKYFDPYTFAKNVVTTYANDLFRFNGGFDRFASFPMNTTEDRGRLTYGKLETFDPACFDALHDLAAEIQAGGRRLVVATMPLHPQWIQRYDPGQRVMPEFERGIRESLTGTSATLWTPDRGFALNAEHFVDAIHIRWSAAREYSRALVKDTRLGQASAPRE